MKKIILFIFLFMFFGLDIVYGDCSSADVVLYKEEVKDIKISYEVQKDVYDEYGNLDKNSYYLILDGLNSNYYAVLDNYGISVGYIIDVKYEGKGNKNKTKYTIPIIAGDNHILIYHNECNEVLRSEDVHIDSYNYYADMPICRGLQNKVEKCNENYQGDVTYDELLDLTYKYNNGNIVNDNKIKLFFKHLLDYVLNHSVWLICGTIMFTILIILFLIIKRKKKRMIKL